MKTRGVKTDYKLLAGIRNATMNDDLTNEQPQMTDIDETFVISSGDENFFNSSNIKTEPLSDVRLIFYK